MNALIEKLEMARRYGDLSDIAFHFAELLGRLDPIAGDPLRLAAALVSQRTGLGHVCVHLPDEANRHLLTNDKDINIVAPPLAEWMAVLKKSSVVTMSGEYRPLVLEPDGRLYLYRYWDWEKRLAEDLLVRAQLPDFDIEDSDLSQALTTLFPLGLGSSDQKVAAALSVLRPLSVITGGPGSGKTTTVVRTVALLQAITGMAADAFTLAAPTGKAAARLREVFLQSVTLPGLVDLQVPEHTTTIHRLLGIHAADGNPFHDNHNPLTCRVLIVDEASMIDLGLMVKLLEAMPRHGRLILLGDRDQLASVEAGSVLEDICNGAEGLPAVLAARLSRVTGVQEVSGATPGNVTPLAGSLAVLGDSWRYDRTSDIGKLASAVQAGDVTQAIDCLQNSNASATTLLPYEGQLGLVKLLIERIVSGYSHCLSLAVAGAQVHRVFESYGELRVLCAHRSGVSGVSGINRLIEQQLIKIGQIPAGVSWYPGRPVIILSNDYRLGLFNGDIGIALVDPDRPTQLAVYFPQSSGAYRAVWPGRLPAHDTVYAMTVHKSQGSEFSRSVLVLPERPSPVLSRELIYTALSRAVHTLEIWGSRDMLSLAVSQRARRQSGLQHRLQ